MRRLANIALALVLLGGTSAAFAVSEKLKLERSPVTAPDFDRVFSPVCECETERARLRLRFREDEVVDASIVGPEGTHVRQLVEDEAVEAGVHTFVWDGRNDAGEVVSDARYRLQVHLERSRRTILVPTTVQVDTRPPKLTAVRLAPDVFSPDGDGRGDRVKIGYRSGERARAELVVDGEVAVRSRMRPRGGSKLTWGGRLAGATLPRGEYTIVLELRDSAGNVSQSEPLAVRIRYIEIEQIDETVPVGGTLTFTVGSDSLPYRWFLYRSRGERFGGPAVLKGEEAGPGTVEVELPGELAPGRYQLRVVAGERKHRAVVVVTGSSG